MASKQLGKLRQWAGEVISTRDKTTYSDEFKDVDKDIELRKTGADKLHAASEGYHHALTKKRDSEALNDPEKLLPIDALGIVMIVHGEQFPEDSVYGSSLLRLGRAHCKIATLQEAYALDFQDTFLASIQRFQEDVKDYEAHKKKLESRRLSYDAAVTKAEKSKNKKEKERREAEEDLEVAKQRYEETLEDVRAKMVAIQESEMELQKDLTGFLELEYKFVEQYLGVLQDVKSDWPTPLGNHKRSTSVKHPMLKSNSVRSKRSARSSARSNHASDNSEDDVSPQLPPAISRRSSTHGRSGSISSSRPPSRPTSRLSRKRTDSTATANGEKEKEKGDKAAKKMSISGWSGWGKKTKDKDFANLDDPEALPVDADGGIEDGEKRVHRAASNSSLARRMTKRSKDSLATASPKIGSRIFKTSQPDRKVVRALYDFNGSSDELSFKVGDEIVILNEVTDDWWMGEVSGRKGLFPTSYTVIVPSPKPPSQRSTAQKSPKAKRLSISSDEAAGHRPLINDASEASELDEEENTLSGNPLSPNASPFYLPHDDNFVSASEDEHSRYPSPYRKSNGSRADAVPPAMQRDFASDTIPNRPPLPTRSMTADAGRKVPPPPPPRRTTQLGSPIVPPVPDRRPNSVLGLPGSTTASLAPSSQSSLGYDVSPFESTNELAACTQFKQHPFKTTGICSNCFQFHHGM